MDSLVRLIKERINLIPIMKKLFTYPLTYTITILILYTIYDYFEHIGRTGSTFEEQPWNWLLFSSSAVLSFFLVVLLVKKGLEKISNQKLVVFEVLSIGIWLVFYISFIGPLINKLFWPFDQLYFNFSFGPFVSILIAYFLIRMAVNFIVGRKVLYSN